MLEKNKEDFGSTTIIFTLKNEVGGLIKALKLFQEKHVNLIHIESRKSKRRNSDFEIFVDCDTDHEQFKELAELLRKHTDIVEISPLDGSALPEDDVPGVPWFPKKISDLDLCVNRVLMYGSELDADHPGFKDNVYRKRRQYFSGLAKNYKQNTPVYLTAVAACHWLALTADVLRCRSLRVNVQLLHTGSTKCTYLTGRAC
uniref:Tryptophan hydroxylase 1 n=1 Tax=Neolamprologus brichardi TaxID=32507 RepID=A0A3Q4M4H1_NEOBR